MPPYSFRSTLSRWQRMQPWLATAGLACASITLAHAANAADKKSTVPTIDFLAKAPERKLTPRMLTDADGHKFYISTGSQRGWIYGMIESVTGDEVDLYTLATHFDVGRNRPGFSTSTYPIATFDSASQKYINEWVVKHPEGQPGSPLPATPLAPTGVLMPWPNDLIGFVDTSGLLKGRTVTAITAAPGGRMLALCSDGTLVTWGTTKLDPLGYSISPVRVPLPATVKDKKIMAIQDNGNAIAVLCDDGYLYSLLPSAYQPLLDGPLKGRTVVAFGGSMDIGADGSLGLLDPLVQDARNLLTGKKVAAVTSSAALCTDGTLAVWQPAKKNSAGSAQINMLFSVKMEGVLQDKTITAIAETYFDNCTRLMALCSDGTLVGWGGSSKTPGAYYTISPPVLTDRTKQAISPEDIILRHMGNYTPKLFILSGTGALKGKTVTGIVGSLIQCSDGTAAYWTGNTPPAVVDYAGALKGKTILAAYCIDNLDLPIVLFKEPTAPVTQPVAEPSKPLVRSP